jgi:hypothetical protein
MFRKIALAALAASAVIGASMIAPTSASAFGGFRGNAGFHGNGGFHGGPRINAGFRPNIIRPNPCRFGYGCHPYNPWYVHNHRRPIWYGAAPVIAAPVAYAATQASTCNCLTKQYTPEGAVLFKDLCTNEAALNAPAQQTGMIQPQQQAQ